MAAQGDIVFMIGADVAGLTQAGSAGEKSLADMERAAKRMEGQLVNMGKTALDFKGSVANLAKENRALYDAMKSAGEAAQVSQRAFNEMLGVNTRLSQSARDSAAAFEAFDRSRAQVDNLRASIDPLFAASKRYEAALVQLDGALEQGTISAREHANMVDMLSQSYLRADGAAATMGGGMGVLGGMSQNTRMKLQQVGFQVQDFAVQVGAGTSATQAFAQQFPQMAGAFGPWGVAIGTAAAILVPLGAAFFAASSSAEKLTSAADRQAEIFDALAAATSRLALERQMLFSGAEFAEEQEALNEINRLVKEREAVEARLTKLITLGGRTAGFAAEAAAKREALQAEVDGIDAKIEALNQQRAITKGAEETNVVIQRALTLIDAIGAADLTGPWTSVLGSIEAAIQKAREFAATALMNSKVYSGRGGDPSEFGANPGGSNTFDTQNFATADPTGETGGGGGGGGSDPIAAEIERLQQALMTEEQLEMESYAKRQAMLQQALEQRVLTQEDYAKLMENAQAQHQDRMSGIDVYRYGTGLQQAEAFMGGMASALQGGNEQMQKISRVFGAAEALINAWRAFSQTMADPSLPFFAKFGAAASVLSAGMGAVNAIKSGSKSSGAATGGAARASAAVAASSGAGGGSAGAAAAAAPDQSQIVNISLTGDTIGRDGMASLFEQINKGLAKGYRIERVNFT